MLKIKKGKLLTLSIIILLLIFSYNYFNIGKIIHSLLFKTTLITKELQNTIENYEIITDDNIAVNIEDAKLSDNAKSYTKEINTNYDFADLVEFTSPSVVSIMAFKTSQVNTFNGIPLDSLDPLSREFLKRNMPPQDNSPQRVSSVGSGFIIRSDGYIVTNFHVIQGAEQIKIGLKDVTYNAEIFSKDEVTDIAILKINANNLPALKFADSDSVRVGEAVLAIGNPFGLGGSVSSGIVSAIGRDINMGVYNDFIQTDASINRGNSGGPLINMRGEVVGINTAIFSPSTDGGNVGIGFAVPANTAKNVVAQLIASKKVVRSWLGVQIQSVDDNIAKNYNLKSSQGALISSIVEGSPASKSNLIIGDIIIAVNGKEISNNRLLPKIISGFKPGSTVVLTVVSKKETKQIKVKLEAIPDNYTSSEPKEIKSKPPVNAKIKEANYDNIGIRVAQLDDNVRKYFEIPDNTKGIIIIAIKVGSLAQQKGLVAGLIIAEVNQEAVLTLEDFKAAVNKNQDKGLVLLVKDASNRTLFISLSASEIASGLME